MSRNNYKWVGPKMDEAIWQRAEDLSAQLNCPPAFARILINRGLGEVADATAYMYPDLKALSHPSGLTNATKAAERIAGAIKAGQRILVYGDYDVDGVTATSTLYHTLKFFGADVETYVPSREEGYGISGAVAEKIILGLRPALIVTVDCGITGVEAAQVCKKWGVDFIVTDHHDGKEVKPDAFCIVHPRELGPTPAPDLCGAGVAWKVAWAIGLAMSGEDRVDPKFGLLLRKLLMFTALGTVADVVSLTGENRVIVVKGLEEIVKPGAFLGIQALVGSMDLKKEVTGYDVGWRLAPRINAVGRMEHAQEAVRLFTTANFEEADRIVEEMNRLNKQRQDVERNNLEEATAQAEGQGDRMGYVLYDADWFKGTAGLVAGKIAQNFRRPCIALRGVPGKDGMIGGSGRSVAGFNVRGALEANAHLLGNFGGHEAACGVHLPHANLEAFREAFDAHCRARLTPEMLVPVLVADAVVFLDEITETLVSWIKLLGPFGQHNRTPLLAVTQVVPRYMEATRGDGKHLRFKATQGREQLQCMMWRAGHRAHEFPDGRYDLMADASINEWNGRRSVQLIVADILPSN